MKKQDKEDGIVDGFSSDQQVKHEEIIVEDQKKTEVQNVHKEQVKFKIPPPQQIKAKSYSLNPDIATGWAPKNQLPVPIPMLFDNRRVDTIVKRMMEKKHDKMKLIYLGPRYENTFSAWYDKQFQFPYSHIRAPNNMKFTNRAFCGQHWDAEDGLVFDSFFESGNLDLVIQVDQRQYDIYLRVDSNTRGHLQWFNFKVKNLEKLQKYKFNICNLQKNKSLYSRGQKPYILSQKRLQKQKKSWEQSGDSVKFEQKPGKSAKILNTQFNSNYKLSFDYYTQYENDTIQIAYCIPYTYSELTAYLTNLQTKIGCNIIFNEAKNFLTISKLCQSLGGLQIPLLTIHDNYVKEDQTKIVQSCYNKNEVQKKCIIISARVHPGQCNGSHMMQGFLDFICGDTKQARQLRANFIFKIVPMLNPDGVTLGNYRTGISGRDFNRQYRNPDKAIFPEVFAFKKFVIQNKSLYRENLLMFLDFHGHSTKKNVFVYGPQFPIIEKHYYECRVFPKLLGNHTNMFRYYSCSFKVSQFKETTARAIFLRKVMIPLSYTIQASNGSFYDRNALKDVLFNQRSWLEMGKRIGTALAQYCDLVMISERSKIERMQSRKTKKDIKIRKNSKNKVNNPSSNQSPSIYEKEISILGNSENQRILKIFEQIKKAEQEKQLQKNEEDDISEGSSDGQGQKDDLSAQKLNLLFQIIKNKKANISEKYRKRLIQEDSKHAKTNEQEQIQNQMQASELQLKPTQMLLPLEVERETQEQQIFRANPNGKGYFFRQRNLPVAYLQSEQKKQKVAAKIINFSFIGHSKPAFSLERKCSSSNRNTGSQPKIDKSTCDGELKSKIGNFKVLDLSDSSFRQTFMGGSLVDPNKQGERKNLTFFNVSPRKLGAARLEDYKYKRLFIDEYKI